MSFSRQVMSESKTKHRIWIIISIGLISFGVINLSTNVFGQTMQEDNNNLSFEQEIVFSIIENLLTVVAPIVIGAVRMGIQFARTKGLQISAEAEEYVVNQTQSFVDNQFRFMFKELKNNPEHIDAIKKGKFPKELSRKALSNVKTQIKKELESDEFTNVTRQMLLDNLDPLIERYVTKSKNERFAQASKILKELAPITIDSLLLSYKPEEFDEKKDEIIKEATTKINNHLKEQLLLLPEDMIDTFVRADLRKAIIK